MRKIYWCSLFAFLVFSRVGYGQVGSNCAQTLRLARLTYDQGRLHELPALLEGCLTSTDTKNSFTKQEKTDAYRLLTLTYIYLEEPAQADKAMISLLEADHFFKVNKDVEPAEFIALYNKFRTKAIFNVGVKIGVNSTSASVQSNYYVGSNGVGKGKFSPNPSLNFGVAFEKDIKGRFVFGPELIYTAKNMTYDNPSLLLSDVTIDAPILTNTTNIKQNWLDVNLLVQYKLKSTTVSPFVAIGPGFNLLLGSTYEGIQTAREANNTTITGSTLDSKKSFNTLAYSAIVAAGLRVQLGAIYVTGDIRYQYGLSNVVNSSSRTNLDAGFDYAFTVPNYKHNTIMINVGVLYPIFKPKKLVN